MSLHRLLAYVMAVLVSLMTLSCNLASNEPGSNSQSAPGNSGATYSSQTYSLYYGSTTVATNTWTSNSHDKLKKGAILDNATNIVFVTNTVQRLYIEIDTLNWSVMTNNLAYLKTLNTGQDWADAVDPVYVPCDLYFTNTSGQGRQWYKVGIRFKGNSSLYNASSSKLPMKLDFDEFEDVYPNITDQRFYGFKSLNLRNNDKDSSEMRDHLANDLFRDAGFPMPHSSFYELYINRGTGSYIYYGLYTLMEEVDDTVIKTQYESNDGGLYKPEGSSAYFSASGGCATNYYNKKDDNTNYDDILALYAAINASTRTTSIATWKTNLENIFNVPMFLKWLAINTTIQNWDAYGVKTHNFYLYQNPATGKFEWLPCDFNYALLNNNQCLKHNTLSSIASSWVLIKYLMNDSDYVAQYKTYVKTFATNLFNTNRMVPIYQGTAALIQSSVVSEGSSYTMTSASLFASDVSTLKTHVYTRYTNAIAFGQ